MSAADRQAVPFEPGPAVFASRVTLMAMTNAERQKRYRDKKRVGRPPKAESDNGSKPHDARTMWITKHAPDLVDRIAAWTAKYTCDVYRRLKLELDQAICDLLVKGGRREGDEMVTFRRYGKFVCKWRQAHSFKQAL